MIAGEPANGRATAAGLAFVAGHIGVVEIGATCALEQVARSRRLVAQLARGARDQRAREQGIVAAYTRIRREIGVAHQRADAQAAVRCRLDLVEGEAVHINQMGRRFNLELHEIEQVGATRNEFGTLGLRGRRHGVRRRARPFVGEGFHAFLPATSVMASMMLE